MIKIENIDNHPHQKLSMVTEDGIKFSMEIEYSDVMNYWLLSVYFPNNEADKKKVAIVNGIDLIKSSRYMFNFGIVCTSNELIDPSQIDDFLKGDYSLYLMTVDEVDQFETAIRL